MSGVCNRFESNEARCLQTVSNMKGRSYLRDLALDERILLKRILNKCLGDVERICLTRFREQWLAVVNTALSLRIP